jgi:hypothetical protein
MSLLHTEHVIEFPEPDACRCLYCPHLDRMAHDVIQASVDCMKADRRARGLVFRFLLVAYALMFVIGLASFAGAVAKTLTAGPDAAFWMPALLGGMSLASFVALVLFRPLESLSMNSVFQSWLNVTTTSYWTRHYFLNKTEQLNSELETVTQETLDHLGRLQHLQREAATDRPGFRKLFRETG